jgi:hypothetical protein
MMFGFGFLMMFIVVGVPILFVVVLLVAAAGYLPNLVRNGSAVQNQSPVYQPAVVSISPAKPAARYCSHCGTGMQSDWSHCPQCGAAIQ